MLNIPDILRALGACDKANEFAGMTPDEALAIASASDLAWLGSVVLTDDEKAVLTEAEATAWRAFNEATATALRAYREAIATARRAYEEAIAPALRAYREAIAPALRAYREAIAPAERALEEATAPARRAALKNSKWWEQTVGRGV